MIVVTVARKPLSEGTVAANVLKHGCGALNIDASRIATAPGDETTSHVQGVNAANTRHTLRASWQGITESYQSEGQKIGRWPANLILSHLEGCHITGTATIQGDARTSDYSSRQPGFYNIGEVQSDGRPRGTLHGDQEVPVWECMAGCPVAALDGQSGECPGMSGGGDQGDNKKTGNEVVPSFNRKPSAPFLRGDSGGASRFFKQVGGQGK